MEFARPNADISTGEWTTHGAGILNLWQEIDETAVSDADFDRSKRINVGSDEYIVALSDVTDPGTDAGHSVSFRFRREAVFGDNPIDLIVTLLQDTTQIAQWQYGDVDDTFITFTENLSEAEVATITDFTALRMSFRAVVGEEQIVWDG